MAELALSGCLLDASVTTEALAALEPPEEAHTRRRRWKPCVCSFRRSRGAYWACAALAGLCALAALLALAGPRGSRLWPFLASAGVGLAAAAMLLYLAWMGRLPARAAMTVLMPAIALALWLALHGAAGAVDLRERPRRAAAVAAVLVGAADVAPPAPGRRIIAPTTPIPRRVNPPAPGWSAALAHGDRLFIADLSPRGRPLAVPRLERGQARQPPAGLGRAGTTTRGILRGVCALRLRARRLSHRGFRGQSPAAGNRAGAQPSDAFMASLTASWGGP